MNLRILVNEIQRAQPTSAIPVWKILFPLRVFHLRFREASLRGLSTNGGFTKILRYYYANRKTPVT